MNYKLLVAIPSKGRYNKINSYTLSWLKDSKYTFKVFVEPQEIPLYSLTVPRANLVNIGESNKGMGFALNKIRAYAIKNEYDFVMKIDDDCKGFAKYPEISSIEAFERSLEEIIPAFDIEPTLGGVRFIQKRFWLYSKKENKLFSHRNKALWGIALYRTKAFPELPSYVTHFDDTIHSLFMWREGWNTLTYRNAGVDVLQNSGKGGHQSFDRKHEALTTITKLKEDQFPLLQIKKNTNETIGIDIDISAYENYSII